MEVDVFRGFPAGRLRLTPVPDLFFTTVLPAIDNLAELRVTLHLFYLLTKPARAGKGVSAIELASDTALQRGLRLDGGDLTAALQAAVGRGGVLRCRLRNQDALLDWYFLNTETGREALDRAVRAGEAVPESGDTLRGASDRPNVFSLYEQNIGLLQPLIVEELQEAQKLYPGEWIEEAFKIAVENNVRRWRYISAILERWRNEGKDHERAARDDPEDGRGYLTGKYADRIKH